VRLKGTITMKKLAPLATPVGYAPAPMSDRALLMIPGPIEIEPDVMAAFAARTTSHLDPGLMAAFGRVLRRLREVVSAPSSQPFVVAGSGTLAMEMAVANLVEPGDRALVINTGYFGDRMGKILERHGAEVMHARRAPGDAPSLDEIDALLSATPAKVVTITHVDTSTGVRTDVEGYAKVAKARGALVVVDGVCSVAGERLLQDAWGIDVVLSASQKALGAPPGLAVLTVSPTAMDAFRARKRPVASVYADFSEWLPIMDAYEHGRPAYFATPPVNLIAALDASLAQIVAEGMDRRVARHERMANAFRAAWASLGLRTLPVRPELQALTLSALYYPDGVDASLVARVREEGVVIAGGLHPDLRTRYFRVGHMGAISASDVLATVGAVSRALVRCGHRADASAAVAAAERVIAAV
jgi:alanine-glyoxylate transaminase/serine-glyoxylate transaminase/serine-pyruvate transaminase